MEGFLEGLLSTSGQVVIPRIPGIAEEVSPVEGYAGVPELNPLSDSLRDAANGSRGDRGVVRVQGQPRLAAEARRKMPPKPKNLFLSSLSAANRDLIVSRSTAVPLRQKMRLLRRGQRPNSAYFITSGLASMVMEMADGSSAEVGMVGRDGVVGALHVLGPSPSTSQCFVQMEGTALRIPMAELRNLFDDKKEIRVALLKFVQRETMSLSQVAGCNRLHSAEERLARWLLTAQDYVQSDELNFTQSLLANMLGARRATVTLIAGALQRAGLIQYQRGRVTILDRERLEEAACDCYRVIKELRGDLYNMS